MREMCVHTMHLEWELEKKTRKNGINVICTIVSETKFLLVRLHHLSRLIWKHNNVRKILLRKRIFVWLENGLKSDQRAQLTLVSLNWSHRSDIQLKSVGKCLFLGECHYSLCVIHNSIPSVECVFLLHKFPTSFLKKHYVWHAWWSFFHSVKWTSSQIIESSKD